MAKDDWLREYLELMNKQIATNHSESMKAIADVSKTLYGHCTAQDLTNREVAGRLSVAEVKVKRHDGLVKGAWGLISALIVSILTWVGTLIYNLFIKGEVK